MTIDAQHDGAHDMPASTVTAAAGAPQSRSAYFQRAKRPNLSLLVSRVDGQDAPDICERARAAVDHAPTGRSPVLLERETYSIPRP